MVRGDSSRQTNKDIIVSKFWELYKTKPLCQISVTDLSKACGISRGTFYQYFENVYALYFELEAEAIRISESGLSDVILCAIGKNFEKFIEVSSRHLSIHIEHLDMFQSLLNGSEEGSFRKMWFESIHNNFVKVLDFSGDYSKDDNNLTLFFAGGLLSVLSNWVLNDCIEPVENIARVAMQIQSKGALKK
ncbi:MAG: TetR/AcrR family transcriptional regulator [Clostridiales bacterium]|nr:TetR/AcrR family transcriptional regulator [Clostridiales bacterium]